LNLILNYVFIPIFGYYAAGYTTLISYIVLTLFHYAFYKKIIKENLNKKISLYNEKMIAISTIFVFAVMFLMIFLYDYYFVRYGLIVVILLIGIIKRNKIKELIVTIRE
jgi:O-antigen/teichoic acid export membrane protein